MNLPKYLEVMSSEWHCHESSAWEEGLHAEGTAFVRLLKTVLQEHQPLLEPRASFKLPGSQCQQASCPVQQTRQYTGGHEPMQKHRTHWLWLVWWPNTAKKPILCSSWGYILEALSSFLTCHRLVRGWETWEQMLHIRRLLEMVLGAQVYLPLTPSLDRVLQKTPFQQ